MADKLMYLPNDETQNPPFCRLQLVVETIGHSTKWTKQSKYNKKSPKLLSQRIRKSFDKTSGSSKINKPMFLQANP